MARWGRRPCMWVACRLHVSHQQCLCLVLRRKLTLRASRRSVALSNSIHGRSARARRVYACSRGRRKRPLVVCTCVLGRRPCMGCYMACVASMLPEHCRRPHGYGNAFQAALSKPSTLAGTTPLTAMFQVLPPPPMEMLAVQPMEVLAVQPNVQPAAQRDSSLRMAETVCSCPPHDQ